MKDNLAACIYLKDLWDTGSLHLVAPNYHKISLGHMLSMSDRELNQGHALFLSDIFSIAQTKPWYTGNPVFTIGSPKYMHEQPNHYDLSTHIGKCNYELLLSLIHYYQEQIDELLSLIHYYQEQIDE